MAQAKNLYEKVWETHSVAMLGNGQTQLLIGTHLIHEVTSPQAFGMLRDLGLKVRYPHRTFATVDHIVPTDTRVEPFAGIRADGYTIADVSFYQELTSRARLQLQITNITDKQYATSSLFAARVGNFPGQPRAMMLTFAWTPFRK